MLVSVFTNFFNINDIMAQKCMCRCASQTSFQSLDGDTIGFVLMHLWSITSVSSNWVPQCTVWSALMRERQNYELNFQESSIKTYLTTW